MKRRMCIVAIMLVTGALLTMLAACDGFRQTPTPTAIPTPSIPAGVLSARDAALAHLRQVYPSRAPPEGIVWKGRETTAHGLVGLSSYEFTGDSWFMAVRVPMVSPDSLLYEMELQNQDSGFRWTGKLNQKHAIVESNLDVAVEALTARDLVLQFVRQHYTDQAPPESLVWVGERTTPEGSIGHESCRFVSGDWTMTVAYDLGPPDQIVFEVELRNASSDFLWRGQVNAQGEILEHR